MKPPFTVFACVTLSLGMASSSRARTEKFEMSFDGIEWTTVREGKDTQE